MPNIFNLIEIKTLFTFMKIINYLLENNGKMIKTMLKK